MTTTLTVIVGLGIVLIAWIAYSYIKLQRVPLPADHPNVKQLTQNNFKQHVSGGLILVDFWASWCGPCKVIGPILNEIAEEQQGKLRIGKVNVDNQQTLAAKYKVRNIPTLVLFKNGKEVKRFVGLKPKKTLVAEVEQFM